MIPAIAISYLPSLGLSDVIVAVAAIIFLLKRNGWVNENGGYEGFEEMKTFIESHDVAFLNLESTFHEREGVPAAASGGTWAMSDPRTLDDMKEYGFNLFNTANNHSGDYRSSSTTDARMEEMKLLASEIEKTRRRVNGRIRYTASIKKQVLIAFKTKVSYKIFIRRIRYANNI